MRPTFKGNGAGATFTFGVKLERHDVAVMSDVDDGVLKLIAAGEAGSLDLVPLARKLCEMRTDQMTQSKHCQ